MLPSTTRLGPRWSLSRFHAKDIANAENALCVSNMLQWGIAIPLYTGDCENWLPDNSDGFHVSWMGIAMAKFSQNYLIKSKETQAQKDKFYLIFCPTDQWHRLADLWRWDDPNSEVNPILTGYFYLPGRVTGSWDYAVNGIEAWHTRKKLGGRYSAAPILIDRMQGLGNWSPRNNNGSLQWTTTDGESRRTVPSATHRGQGAVPAGGSFLLEECRVEWRRFDVRNPRGTVDLGSSGGSWQCFDKIDIGETP